jgi:hypothetical protein
MTDGVSTTRLIGGCVDRDELPAAPPPARQAVVKGSGISADRP